MQHFNTEITSQNCVEMESLNDIVTLDLESLESIVGGFSLVLSTDENYLKCRRKYSGTESPDGTIKVNNCNGYSS